MIACICAGVLEIGLLAALIAGAATLWALAFRRSQRIWRVLYPDNQISARLPYAEARELADTFGGKVIRARRD